MPTGVPIHDVRDQLFAAAERVLLRDGPDALTSRAVTTEAGVAKGLLYRHFSDFDAFLAALVVTYLERLDVRSAQLRASAGSATVTDNLAGALADALSPGAMGMVALVCSRQRLLELLRATTPAGVPLLAQTTRMLAGYLTAERGLGRIALEADVDTVAMILVGAAHLLVAGRDRPATPDDLREAVATTIDRVAREPPRPTDRTQRSGEDRVT